MFRREAWTGAIATTIALMFAAAPALAIYAILTTTLTGAAINGVVPQGTAMVDQSRLPARPGTLEVTVTSVDLPNGTLLSVVLSDCGPNPVGTIKLSQGQGKLKTALPVGCQIGRTSSISVLEGGTTILSGGAPWTVG